MNLVQAKEGSASFFKWDMWSKWVLFLLVGYALTGRCFSYLGIPPAKLFIGDLTLTAFIFFYHRKIFDSWIVALTKGGPLGPFSWILIPIGYCIFEVIRGVMPLLHRIFVVMPASDGVPAFGQAGGGGLVILSLVCLDPKPARWWPAMAIAAATFLAALVRAEWLGTGVATLLWGVLSRKMSRVAMIGLGIFTVLAIGALLDVNLPSPGERGGAISSTDALGHSGWFGVVIFFSLQFACASMLWRVYRLTGQAYGLAVWAANPIAAFFGNVMETPSGAIPLYLTMGLIVGPTLHRASTSVLHSFPPHEAYEPEPALTA